jgi:hypothetical protein
LGRLRSKIPRHILLGVSADMQSLLVDVEENVPKDEGAFMKVEDERVRADCNFRKVCDR